jgi:hypothetical protein
MEAEERSREEAHQQQQQHQQEQEDTEMQASGETNLEEQGDVLYYVDADGNKIEPQDMQDFALASCEDIQEEEQEAGAAVVTANGQQQQDTLALMADEPVEDAPMQIEHEPTQDIDEHHLQQSQLQSTSEAVSGVEQRVHIQPEAETGIEEVDLQAQAARFERPFKPRASAHTPTATSTSANSNGYSLDTEESQKPDFKLRYILTGHRKNVSSIKFSPDGKYLITAGEFTLRESVGAFILQQYLVKN